jgi:hypothetical protein
VREVFWVGVGKKLDAEDGVDHGEEEDLSG